jgi:hypothetical protein
MKLAMTMTRLLCALSTLLMAGCDSFHTMVLAGTDGGGTDPNGSDPAALQPLPEPKLTAELVLDPGEGVGAQAYLCVATPIEDASDVQIETVKWFPPRAGVVLHHVSLYAARGPLPSGPMPCDPLPDLVATLGIYTPGNEPLTFPPGVAVQFPEQTSHLYFVAHVIRIDDAPADPTRVELGLAAAPAAHAAQWVDVFADVPIIPPHETRRSTGSCLFLSDAHAITVWAHMHRHGRRFEGTLVRANGTREQLINISNWDFNHQPVYPLDVQIHAGDSVETLCEWENLGDVEVVPGPFTENEMCNQGLFVWPPEGTHCVPSL